MVVETEAQNREKSGDHRTSRWSSCVF